MSIEIPDIFIFVKLNVKGWIIVADVLYYKAKSAGIVVKNAAYFLFVVKDNNKKIR